MTPPAATAAGRALPRTAVPRAPRRVSGPARPAAPRARRAPGARTTAAPRTANGPLALRALRRGRLLADSRLLDRLVRGQLWIPLVAVGLMGIVFMQVTMLKFNAGIGRAVQTASTLERQNANLRSDVSRMESGDRIDTVAHGLGMVVPADGGEHYVRAGAADTASRAAQKMAAPDPTALARAKAATAAAGGVPAATTTATTAVTAPAATPTTTAAAAIAPVQAPVTPTPTATQTPVAQQTPAATQQTPAATPTPTPTTQQAATPTTSGAATAPVTPSATTAAATAGGAAAPAGN